ncbi:hypothetical protein GUITHDRAFT_150627, partial [Guillardia theta CCMP2712]
SWPSCPLTSPVCLVVAVVFATQHGGGSVLADSKNQFVEQLRKQLHDSMRRERDQELEHVRSERNTKISTLRKQSEKISSAARKLANRQLDQYNEIFSRGSTEEDPTRNFLRGNRRRMDVGREHETPKQLAQHVEKQLENDAEAVSRILAARGKGSRILELKSILEQSLKRVWEAKRKLEEKHAREMKGSGVAHNTQLSSSSAVHEVPLVRTQSECARIVQDNRVRVWRFFYHKGLHL